MTNPSSEQPTKAQSDRKHHFMKIAAQVFNQKGYREAGMREIASLCGVKPAALYYYFPSKEKILEAICNYGVVRLYDELKLLQESNLPIDLKFQRAIRLHLTPLIEQEFYVHAFLFQRRHLAAAARNPLNELARSYESLWDALLVEAQMCGKVSKQLDRRVAVLAILGMCSSVARWSKNLVNADTESIIDFYTRFIVNGLKPTGGDADGPASQTS